MKRKTGIQRAVEKFGGSPARLADAVGNGVLRQHVEHWLKSGRVSAERAAAVARVSGVPITDLNNTVDWSAAAAAFASTKTAPELARSTSEQVPA